MAKAYPVPGLGPATRFGHAAAAIVEVRAAEVFEHATGVLDTRDIERVHAMRVSTRRLRAAMEVFAICFEPKEHKRLLKEVKRLADALGERRDRDVAIESLEQIAAELAPADRPGLLSLVAQLRDEQTEANRIVRAALVRAHEIGLERRLVALAGRARSAERP